MSSMQRRRATAACGSEDEVRAAPHRWTRQLAGAGVGGRWRRPARMHGGRRAAKVDAVLCGCYRASGSADPVEDRRERRVRREEALKQRTGCGAP
ncbi:unnamed protein product [Triticum turgidum subsp. durum]|uniref:Uncharacterized protein n=1 Tax=Triticum turgidum subsp. durum TaxID=4567 RepID=A0A9R0RGW1_TRITD|nr:unnamed protein product [Triticum turgidum subsp. durum]